MCPRPTVLIVDDDPSTVRLLQDFLTDVEFTCYVAGDGVEALELARNHAPGLVLLDLDLPGMSGVEVCRALRAAASLPGLKIIVLTALPATEAKEALSAGANDYMTKPFNRQGLLEKIRRLRATNA